jgi:hypothetical protein
MKSLLITWMERIFIYNEIPRREFNYRNAKKLITGCSEVKITKKYLDDIVSEFKRTNFKKTLDGKNIRGEVQAHGFRWEKEILNNVYNVDVKIKYTNEHDLPAEFNNGVNLNIKTTCTPNTVCMADCIRFFESLDTNLNLIVLTYKQEEEKKVIQRVVKVDLTNSKKTLFGDITKEDLEMLVKKVKSVPSNRKPTEEERKIMYELRDKIQSKSKYIMLNIKCNSTQSRVQCSFNKFNTFLKEEKKRIISDDCEVSDDYWFYIGESKISKFIISKPRSFK